MVARRFPPKEPLAKVSGFYITHHCECKAANAFRLLSGLSHKNQAESALHIYCIAMITP
jgi:hypothetical protein